MKARILILAMLIISATMKAQMTDIERQAIVDHIADNMVLVKGGTFTMGGKKKISIGMVKHKVTLSSYYICRFEVTQREWKAVMGTDPSKRKGSDDMPVENVSWEDCQTFITKLNKMTGKNYRLPTEAEWEFAARGGNISHGYDYSGSNDITSVAWYGGNSGSKTTHSVGTKNPNELGLYDMSGNVWEWCQDWWGGSPTTPQTNPTGPSSGSSHVHRGGAWNWNSKEVCHVMYRMPFIGQPHMYDLGLRLAYSITLQDLFMELR